MVHSYIFIREKSYDKKDSKIENTSITLLFNSSHNNIGLLDTIDDLLIGIVVSIHAIIVLILGVIEY